jgi:hypothetical protein
LFVAVVHAEFDFVSTVDGSKHTAATFGEAMDSSDKATNKAMSAAFKYAAFMTFCIPTEGDNDADATSHEVAPKVEAPTGPISDDARDWLASKIDTTGKSVIDFCQHFEVQSLKEFKFEQMDAAKEWVRNNRKAS